MTAATIGLVRVAGLPSYRAEVLNDVIYGVWFILSAALLLLTLSRPWSLWGRMSAAIAAGAFVMLGADVIARSITAGVIPWLLAYHLIVSAARSKCQT